MLVLKRWHVINNNEFITFWNSNWIFWNTL